VDRNPQPKPALLSHHPHQQPIPCSLLKTFLKKQEATGKFCIHHEPFFHPRKNNEATTSTNPPETNQPHGYVYTEQILLHMPNPQPLHQISPPHATNIHLDTQSQNTQFHLSIARPKLDFSTFFGGEPINWLRLCEKYFALANAPMKTWVALATLHCHGLAQI
jgi:hypothetical protein